MNRKFFFAILIIIVCSGIYLFQNIIDKEITKRKGIEFIYLPDSKLLKHTCIGFENLVSDIYWIKGVLYFGRNNFDENYPFQLKDVFTNGKIERKKINWEEKRNKLELLDDILNIVVELDPYFQYPYFFGGLFLSMKLGEFYKAIEILRKGEKVFPNQWRFPFWIGFNYLFYVGDTNSALLELLKSAKLPGCPEFVLEFIKSIVKKSGRKEIVITFLKGAKDSEQNNLVKNQIDKLLSELKE